MMTAQRQTFQLKQIMALECMCGTLMNDREMTNNLVKVSLFGAKAYCFCPVCFAEVKDGDKDPAWRKKVDRFFSLANKKLRK